MIFFFISGIIGCANMLKDKTCNDSFSRMIECTWFEPGKGIIAWFMN